MYMYNNEWLLYYIEHSLTIVCLQHLDRELDLEAANGKKLLASVVFTHALRYFKECCLRELRDQTTTPISAEDIHWVITVPAIWRQSAKQFMRFAATQVRPFQELNNFLCPCFFVGLFLFLPLHVCVYLLRIPSPPPLLYAC